MVSISLILFLEASSCQYDSVTKSKVGLCARFDDFNSTGWTWVSHLLFWGGKLVDN